MTAGKTYVPLATQTLGSAAASVTFSGISGAYTDLVLVCNVTCASAHTAYVQYNGDTGANYSATYLNGNGTSATSGRQTGETQAMIGFITAGMSSTNPANLVLHIQNYANTTTYKTGICRSALASAETEVVANLWRSTAAITSVLVKTSSGNYQTGSTFTLYGILAA